MNKPVGIGVGVGIFFGLLLGYGIAVVTGSINDPGTTRAPAGHAGPERTTPRRPPPPREEGEGEAGHGSEGGTDASIARIHFMKKFVAALTSKPQNAHPNPAWKSPMKAGAAPIQCTDCHKSPDLDFNRMREMDPGAEAVNRFRHAPQFMIALMEKWTAKLNREMGDRLTGPVDCTTCHAVDPHDKFQVYPAFMTRFVRALYEKPQNKEPASRWAPLVKDPASTPVKCSTCHEGLTAMDRMMGQDLPRPEKYATNHAFMEELMTMWVEELNSKLGPLLTKVVVCGDCHETDPRK